MECDKFKNFVVLLREMWQKCDILLVLAFKNFAMYFTWDFEFLSILQILVRLYRNTCMVVRQLKNTNLILITLMKYDQWWVYSWLQELYLFVSFISAHLMYDIIKTKDITLS